MRVYLKSAYEVTIDVLVGAYIAVREAAHR